MKWFVLLIAVFGILCSPLVVSAQSVEEVQMETLRQRLLELQAEQDRIRGDLTVTQQERQTLQRAINSLRYQIQLVQNQINATDVQIGLTQSEIGNVQDDIAATRAEMSRKRETIGRMILFLEQRDREDLIASLFKYAGFSEFFRQLDDIAAVQQRLLGVINELKKDKAVLENNQLVLESKQGDLEDLNSEATQRKNQLAGVRNEQNRVLTATKGQEAVYQAQIAAIEKEKEKFFTELRELELKAASGGLFIVHITADQVPPKGTKLFMWPEDNYYLTQGYGYTAYARRGAYGGAGHNGIDIAAGYGSPIKAIGAGTIVSNGTGNPGWGNWIAIQHPNNMVSLYAHMSSFAPLKVGTIVAVGQVIGYEGNTGNVTGSHLHLSLYRDFFTYLKGDQLYFNYFDGTLNPRDYM